MKRKKHKYESLDIDTYFSQHIGWMRIHQYFNYRINDENPYNEIEKSHWLT